MAHYSRRDFLKTALAAAALAGAGSFPLRAARETATDWVTLGKSGVKVTRLAFGTGTLGGRVQRELGQDQFTRLVRYVPRCTASRRCASFRGTSGSRSR
jgi:anaerobic selenocysteine-containing dehydrogenase